MAAVVDFIHWSGARPSEAVKILKTPTDGKQRLRPINASDKKKRHKKGVMYIAYLPWTETKTGRDYDWGFMECDKELYTRLQAAATYFRAKPLTYRQLYDYFKPFVVETKANMSDGRLHIMYSMRRAIAQEAYDNHLAQHYTFEDESDDEPEPPSMI